MKNLTAAAVLRELRRLRNPAKAKILSGFFKTGKGHYGEGDVFLGLTVPVTRACAKRFRDLPLKETLKVLRVNEHEARLFALLILVDQFRRGDEKTRREIYDAYLANTRWINNWDLVDLSAEHIVGGYLDERPKTILTKLAKSRSLWERRIAILATFHFIKQGDCNETLKIANLLLHDTHDLIHKAVGWMLREVGKRCGIEKEEAFLKRHASHMPRTTLRYAIERFPETKRQRYLKG